MENRKADVVILGAGTAGLVARRQAEKEGASTLLVAAPPLGTTCARTGCMPSKLLIEASKAAYQVRNSKRFGIFSDVRVDGKKVMERVHSLRDFFVESVMDTVSRLKERKLLIEEKGAFLNPRTLRAGNTTLEAKAFVIATGTRPRIPEAFRPFGEFLVTHESFFDGKDLPESILIAGTGVMGMEIGQALHRLGVRVTFIGLGGKIIGLRHPDVKEEACRVFGEELDLFCDHELQSLERDGEGIKIRFTAYGRTHERKVALILIAAGNQPNLDAIGLDKAGFESSREVLEAYNPRTGQIGNRPFFLAGDVSGKRPVLHEAADEGKIAGYNAARFPDTKSHERKTEMYLAFTEPQAARVGRLWDEEAGASLAVAGASYTRQGRARVMAENKGCVRLYAERNTGRFCGAELLAPEAEHLAHLLAWALDCRLTVREILKLPFYHPVLEEGLHSAFENLLSDLEKLPPSQHSCDEEGPGT